MPTDTKLSQLIINELTEEQYKGLTPNDDELYLTPDAITSKTDGSVDINGGLTVATNGDVEVGKNLEVDGTTKLNGGFEPIHKYPIKIKSSEPATLDIWTEIDANYGNYYFIGKLLNSLNIGQYHLEDGKITSLEFFDVEDYAGFYYYSYFLNEKTGELESGVDYTPINRGMFESEMSDHLKTLFGNQSLVGDGNIDLYRHKLTLNGSTATLKFTFEFISSKNLVCDSVADLRTLIGGTGDTFNGFYIADSSITNAPSGVAYLTVNPSVCQFYYIAKDSTTPVAPINITTVADKVTTI